MSRITGILSGGPREGAEVMIHPWQTWVTVPLDYPLVGYDEYLRVEGTSRFEHHTLTVLGVTTRG